ncbi:hypothetical protein Ciccas_006207 [Cichlidogyrus casuarinus]|uniref:Transmembrane protein family 132 fourth domain-containing protein n=1 Tax=Cichlidogyrus casuarinus TaxID=1844966 RepID=A0ABD2Q6I9_9PLAT
MLRALLILLQLDWICSEILLANTEPSLAAFSIFPPLHKGNHSVFRFVSPSSDNIKQFNIKLGTHNTQVPIRLNRKSDLDGSFLRVYAFQNSVSNDTGTLYFLCHMFEEPTNGCCSVRIANFYSSPSHFQCGVTATSSNCLIRAPLPSDLWKDKSDSPFIIEAAISRQTCEDSHFGFSAYKKLTSIRRDYPVIKEIGGKVKLVYPKSEIIVGKPFMVQVLLPNDASMMSFRIKFQIRAGYPLKLRTVQQCSSCEDWKVTVELTDTFTKVEGKRSLQTNPESGSNPEYLIFDLIFDALDRHSSATDLRILWLLDDISYEGAHKSAKNDAFEPVVTRFPIQSDGIKHIALVNKDRILVNLAGLTGREESHAVIVMGLTQDDRLLDVTNQATCDSANRTVIGFHGNNCTKGMIFAGHEQNASEDLAIFAKYNAKTAISNVQSIKSTCQKCAVRLTSDSCETLTIAYPPGPPTPQANCAWLEH